MLTTFSPQDAPLIRMVARWVEDGDTPSVLPKTLAKHLSEIAKDIEHQRSRDEC